MLSQLLCSLLLFQRLPDQPTHEAHLRLPAQMLRLNQVPTAFKEKARQVHGEEALGPFDTLPMSLCDSASWGEKILFLFLCVWKRGRKGWVIFQCWKPDKIFCARNQSILLLICLWSWTHSVKGLEQSQWALLGDWGQNGYRDVLGYFLPSHPLELKLSLWWWEFQ